MDLIPERVARDSGSRSAPENTTVFAQASANNNAAASADRIMLRVVTPKLHYAYVPCGPTF